jgi:hypothetical protein
MTQAEVRDVGAAQAETDGVEVVRMTARREWSVDCRDVAGRKRELTVFASGGHIVLVAPPGETAVLAPLEVGRLRAILRDAAVDASVIQP